MTLIERLDRYLAMLAPHAKEREGGQLLIECRDRISELEQRLATLTERNTELDINQHCVADAFWWVWRENSKTHKHGYYESTWMALRAAIDSAIAAARGANGGGEAKG
jgi:hypothetical protein